MRVLVVEDDKQLAAALRRGLEEEGYAVDTALDGVEGEWLATENSYDALVLDVMLPQLRGDELCARRREAGDWTPILMLTARSGPEQEAQALDAGADDFLAKPFSFVVLLARLRSLLRRGVTERPTVLTIGDLALDPASKTVSRNGEPISLTSREFSLLEFLMRRDGVVVTKADILDNVWDYAYEGDPNIVEVYIGRLRRKVDKPFDRDDIQTLRGSGYRLGEPPTTARG